MSEGRSQWLRFSHNKRFKQLKKIRECHRHLAFLFTRSCSTCKILVSFRKQLIFFGVKKEATLPEVKNYNSLIWNRTHLCDRSHWSFSALYNKHKRTKLNFLQQTDRIFLSELKNTSEITDPKTEVRVFR